jgi:hypothetical protein
MASMGAPYMPRARAVNTGLGSDTFIYHLWQHPTVR